MAALAIPIPPLPPEADPNYGRKLKFAMVYLKLRDSTRAAMQVCDPGMALQVADKWVFDPIVVNEMERITQERPEILLPSKEEILIDIKRRADSAVRHIDYVACMELYCKVRDLIPKPGSITVPVNVQVQSVMVVPSQGSNEDWERRSSRSQDRLIINAAS